MRHLFISSVLVCVLESCSLAVLSGQVMVEGISEDIAINRAKNKVPEGKTITNISCKEIDVAKSTHYRCTVTWH